ncbi:hypothetical protein [Streptomyces cinereoruber]|uniref:hypothetical protein n=1 Tax=Streptomyces cinereoruber TaxID=67260 RepID=UPI003C2AB52D
MTENAPEQTEDWNDVEQSAAEASYPEFPGNPHNHRYTISMNGQGPMVVVRGNTAEEINAACEELREQGVGAVLGSFWTDFNAAVKVASGLGGATPLPAQAGPPAPPQGAPTPPPFGPNVSVPAAPGYAGPPAPPAPPAQQGGWQQGGQQKQARDNLPEFRQNGWYALTVPFPKGKAEFDGVCAQYQMKKGRPAEGGQFSFNGANKTWYVHPQYAGAFPQFNPVPA